MGTIIYTRYSPRPKKECKLCAGAGCDACKDTGEAECESCERQLARCRELCARNCWIIDHEIMDKDVSGGRLDRIKLWDCIQRLEAGGILLVDKLDRLSRGDVMHTYQIERAVAKHKAKIISVQGEGTWNETPSDKLIKEILQSFARFQRAEISQRTRAAKLRHLYVEHRNVTPGFEPWGWMPDPINPTMLTPCYYEAAVARYIEWLHKVRKMAACPIVRQLVRMKLPFRGRFAAWHENTVWRVLKKLDAGQIPPLDAEHQLWFDRLTGEVKA